MAGTPVAGTVAGAVVETVGGAVEGAVSETVGGANLISVCIVRATPPCGPVAVAPLPLCSSSRSLAWPSSSTACSRRPLPLSSTGGYWVAPPAGPGPPPPPPSTGCCGIMLALSSSEPPSLLTILLTSILAFGSYAFDNWTGIFTVHNKSRQSSPNFFHSALTVQEVSRHLLSRRSPGGYWCPGRCSHPSCLPGEGGGLVRRWSPDNRRHSPLPAVIGGSDLHTVLLEQYSLYRTWHRYRITPPRSLPLVYQPYSWTSGGTGFSDLSSVSKYVSLSLHSSCLSCSLISFPILPPLCPN